MLSSFARSEVHQQCRSCPRAHLLTHFTNILVKDLLVLACSSAVENLQFKIAKSLGFGEQIDCDDLPACECEDEDDTWSSARSPHESNSSIYERRLCIPGTPRELPGY